MSNEGASLTAPGLWARLRRRLWREDPAFAARRRCRAAIGIPFAAIAGVAWGGFASTSLVGGPLLWASVGAVSFSLFIYLELKLIGPIGQLVSRLWPTVGGLAGLAWETVVVGGLFYFVTRVLGAPVIPAAGTALGLGAMYAVAMEYLVCGSAASDLVLLVNGAASGAGARARLGLSRAEALAQQGRIGDARELYLDAIDLHPHRVEPYLGLSALAAREGDHESALELLRDAVSQARLGEEEDAFLVRRIWETCTVRLGDPRRAIPDLEGLIDRQRRTEHATWARWRLRELREE